MPDLGEREDFESLLTHPGWLRLVQEFRQRFDPLNLELKLRSFASTPAEGVQEAWAWLAQKQGVTLVLEYPATRARQILAQESRRA